MPKEGSSEASRGGKEGLPAIAEEKKLSSSAKKSNDEIDEIFASKKKAKGDRGKSKSDNRIGDGLSVGPKKMKKKNDKKGRGGDNFNGVDSEWVSRPRKRTGDGLVIYTEDELGVNKADDGGTPLCPFDCSCCF